MSTGFDKEILQDFLTESGELIQSLEGDLVVLEGAPRDPELLNKVFRALHTIKGSASFLDLKNLVRVAHAAESALNAARNGVVLVDQAMMNLLLEAVDLIKTHLGQVEAGADLTAPRDLLVTTLAAMGVMLVTSWCLGRSFWRNFLSFCAGIGLLLILHALGIKEAAWSMLLVGVIVILGLMSAAIS